MQDSKIRKVNWFEAIKTEWTKWLNYKKYYINVLLMNEENKAIKNIWENKIKNILVEWYLVPMLSFIRILILIKCEIS